jgi:hypothetical protein
MHWSRLYLVSALHRDLNLRKNIDKRVIQEEEEEVGYAAIFSIDQGKEIVHHYEIPITSFS